MKYSKEFFEKVFSKKRMERYFALYPNDEERAIRHYEYNIRIEESLYASLSVLEITLRNALTRELERRTGRSDWYAVLLHTSELANLNKHIEQAVEHIRCRKEIVTPSKITAELTFGFWVSLLNSDYERLLWKDLRKAFPFMPKSIRKRKNISAPLNKFRLLRNRVFHHESICWNITKIEEIHQEIITVIGWMDIQLPHWLSGFDHFDHTCTQARAIMRWQ